MIEKKEGLYCHYLSLITRSSSDRQQARLLQIYISSYRFSKREEARTPTFVPAFFQHGKSTRIMVHYPIYQCNPSTTSIDVISVYSFEFAKVHLTTYTRSRAIGTSRYLGFTSQKYIRGSRTPGQRKLYVCFCV